MIKNTTKKRGVARFPPPGGCREGFREQAYSFAVAYKPLPATAHSNHTPPSGGNEKILTN
jgi:hypothetical protein